MIRALSAPLIAGAFALLEPYAWAADLPPHQYVFVGGSHDQTTVVFDDISSLHSSGSQKTVWELFVYDPYIYVNSEASRYSLSLSTYDCGARTIQMKYVYAYDDGNTMVGSTTSPYADASPIVPDSVEDGLLHNICSTDYPGSQRTFPTAPDTVAVGVALMRKMRAEKAAAQP